jgi:hypothetical protein
MTTGVLALTAIHLPAGTTVTNLSYLSGTTAANTPTSWWFALYTANRALLAQTADQTTTAWAANTVKTLALSAPVTTTYTGLYYMGVSVTATTVPTFYCSQSAGNAYVTDIAPKLNGTSTTGLTTTAPATAAAITATLTVPYGYVS